jgi:hypothetical protein
MNKGSLVNIKDGGRANHSSVCHKCTLSSDGFAQKPALAMS